MKKLRTAVVGVGYLGRFHAQKHNQIENCDLVGVYDSDLNRAQEVAKELNCRAFSNLKEMVSEVDAVTVASTTSTHYEIAKFFLENKIHVLVEKPITSHSDQAKELIELAKKNQCKLQVGHIERFNPALSAVREKLKAMPLFIEAHRLAAFKTRATDVDVVLDLMIHDIDVVLSLVPSEVKDVRAVGVPVLTSAVDICNARIEFESGTIANITASRVSQNAQRKFRVFQSNQYLSIDFGKGEVGLTTKSGDFKDGEIPLEHETWSLEKGDALLLETQSFVNAILEDTEVVVTGEQAFKALKLAEQISELAKNCRS